MVRRFFLPEGPQGAEARLSGQERDHLARVLRLRSGEEVVLFDGRGREWLARVAEVGPEACRLTVVSELAPGAEPGVEVWLVQALLKGPKADWLVQKAVELGVRGLTFVNSERSVARPQGEGKLPRWRRIAAAALKQCRGSLLPEIAGPLALDDLLAQPFDGPRFIFHEASGHEASVHEAFGHEAEGVGLSQALGAAAPLKRVQLLIGPEGGFSEAEVARARAAGLVAVRLGARVLRAETAALAVVSAVLYAAGELG